MITKTGQKGIDLIKKFEGKYLKAYLCPANVWTIGYGHTGNVKPNDTITEKEAEDLLKSDLKKFERQVCREISIDVNQNQFDALVSYYYNTGGSNTLRSLINKRAPIEQIKLWWEGKYISANGKVLEGLIKRRKAEFELFMS